MDGKLVRFSKFLSLVLRHDPRKIGLALDQQGWADVEALIAGANAHGVPLTRALLEQVVAENDKQRFKLSEDGQRIRANQGHTLKVDLELKASQPPGRLYHGTATRFLAPIRRDGLRPGKRQHVHLSLDHETAVKVGSRHGQPVVLVVRAAEMAAAGYLFYLSDNGIWLTAAVPAKFLEFPQNN
jgi:putative RNA 2'-phosphotransferase